MKPVCRGCGAPLGRVIVDLGLSPLSNSYVAPDRVAEGEFFLPLAPLACENCLLVQLDAFETPHNIFSEYAYFSSYSSSWVEHARNYVGIARDRLGLGPASFVAEVASNDGYLLRHFVEAGIPVVGIEPAANVARVAREAGVPTETLFFGAATASVLRERYGPANLAIANNVIAHVPDLHDFVAGFAIILAEDGTWTAEFPHILRLLADSQFDTIYHEHFSYFSLLSLEPVLAAHGLKVVDVDRLSTHGGSLRLWIRRAASAGAPTKALVEARAQEADAGLGRLETYERLADCASAIKRDLLAFLIDARRSGKTVVGYGAPAKGNTLLNYCGIRSDMLAYTVDRNPVKQGNFLPGTRIPIHAPERIFADRPDYVVILPWNLREEIVAEMASVRSWGGRFVVAIPRLEVIA